MALTFNDVVDQVRAVAPEVSQATAVAFVNDRVGRLVARAQASEKVTNLGVTTTSGTSVYALDADTVDVRALRIGDAKYARSTMQEIWEVEAARADVDTRDGKTGLFAPYSPTQVYIYPAPSATGTAITAVETLYPSDSVYSGTDQLVVSVPKAVRHYVRAGAFADAYRATGREDLAQQQEQEFLEGITEFFRARRSQIGSGPARITVLGPGQY